MSLTVVQRVKKLRPLLNTDKLTTAERHFITKAAIRLDSGNVGTFGNGEVSTIDTLLNKHFPRKQ